MAFFSLSHTNGERSYPEKQGICSCSYPYHEGLCKLSGGSVWYGCFASGFSVVWCLCCRQNEAKLQELQELSTESIHKTGVWGNQNREHILSHWIQSPITVYSQTTYSIWQICPVLLQALLGFLSTPPKLFEVCSGTSLLRLPKNPPNFYSKFMLAQFPPVCSYVSIGL